MSRNIRNDISATYQVLPIPMESAKIPPRTLLFALGKSKLRSPSYGLGQTRSASRHSDPKWQNSLEVKRQIRRARIHSIDIYRGTRNRRTPKLVPIDRTLQKYAHYPNRMTYSSHSGCIDDSCMFASPFSKAVIQLSMYV